MQFYLLYFLFHSNFTYHFEEYGVYQIAIKLAPSSESLFDDFLRIQTIPRDSTSNTLPNIQQILSILTPPDNAFLPILYAFLGYLAIAVCYIIYSKLFKKRVHRFVDLVIQSLRYCFLFVYCFFISFNNLKLFLY
jgi:hypothetical protein